LKDHQAFLQAFSHLYNKETEINFIELARYLTYELVEMNRLEEIQDIKYPDEELLVDHIDHIVRSFKCDSKRIAIPHYFRIVI